MDNRLPKLNSCGVHKPIVWFHASSEHLFGLNIMFISVKVEVVLQPLRGILVSTLFSLKRIHPYEMMTNIVFLLNMTLFLKYPPQQSSISAHTGVHLPTHTQSIHNVKQPPDKTFSEVTIFFRA